MGRKRRTSSPNNGPVDDSKEMKNTRNEGVSTAEALDGVKKTNISSSKNATRTHPTAVVDRPFEIVVTIPFLLCTIACCVALTFAIGCVGHRIMIQNLLESGLLQTKATMVGSGGDTYYNFAVSSPSIAHLLNKHVLPSSTTSTGGLPKMYYAENKTAPKTIYSSKTFSDESIHASLNTVLAQKRETSKTCRSADSNDEETNCIPSSGIQIHNSGGIGGIEVDGTNEVHEPAGQHLLIDIENVDADFLNSETRVAQAMVDIVTISGLTMLSYHCHALQPTGISCVGVLLESHISVHTWPIEGVILLDLFTCGPNPLIPLLSLMKDTFGIPKSSPNGKEQPAPHMNWAHKRRGFRNDAGGIQGFDIDRYVEGWLEFDMKDKVVSVETDYQTIDVYDVINPRFLPLNQYLKAMEKSIPSYESTHPEFFQPDRQVFMNGVLQSRRYGDSAYHEALVHPALVAHPNPKRVAIIGGGEGATLREVLKHKTVETVTMIEIDEIMVTMSKEYLKEWNDCSSFVRSTTPGQGSNCFDNERTELHLTDAGAWFIDRFSNAANIKDEDKFDVVIMDALDPQDMVEFADALFTSNEFYESIYNSLTSDGVFISQVGEMDLVKAYPDELRPELRFAEIVATFGYVTVKFYGETHGGFFAPWKFMVAFKSNESKVNWYDNQAEIDLKISERSLEPLDGTDSLFRYYDGAIHQTYLYTSRLVENKFCRSEKTPIYCEYGHGYNPDVQNVAIDSLEVRVSKIEGAGRGLFFKKDFPAGSYVSIDTGSGGLLFMPRTTQLVEAFVKSAYTDRWKTMSYYLFGYGFSSDYFGDVSYTVDQSILTFINHGCNGTYVMGAKLSVTEQTADPEIMTPELNDYPLESQILNPFVDRNHLVHITSHEVLLRDVKAGEELMDNYLGYLNIENWKEGLLKYRAQCLKQAVGDISEYESSEK